MNTGNLKNLMCPRCEYEGHFGIRATIWIEAYDDYVLTSETNPELNWDDNSWCVCKNCGYASELKHFKYT